MKKLKINRKEISSITNKGGNIQVLISPKTVKSTQLVLGTLILKPGETLVEHLHDYSEEVIFVRSGEGKIYIDGTEYPITPEEAALIPMHSKHKVINEGSKDLELVFASAPLAPTAASGDRITRKEDK